MKNKVLIKLIVLELDDTFDLFVPVNEVIWKVKKLIVKSISDLTGIELNQQAEYILLNKDNCKLYSNNEIIINTDIRNSTELILISANQ